MRRAAVVALLLVACQDELSPIFYDAGTCTGQVLRDTVPEGCPAPAGYGMRLGGGALPTATIRQGNVLLARAQMCDQAEAVDLQLYFGQGSLPATPTPGRYVLGAADGDFATCAICVRLFQGLDLGGNPTDIYLATSGVLDLRGLEGERFHAVLTNLQMRQVTIDPGDFETHEVSGCRTVMGALGIGDLLLQGSVSPAADAGGVDSFEAPNVGSP